MKDTEAWCAAVNGGHNDLDKSEGMKNNKNRLTLNLKTSEDARSNLGTDILPSSVQLLKHLLQPGRLRDRQFLPSRNFLLREIINMQKVVI